MNVSKFLEKELKKEIETIKKHKNILEKVNFNKNLDYLKVRPFFITAYNQLTKIDKSLKANNELVKLYENANEIFEIYQQFLKKVKFDEVLYQKYLETLPEYKKLLQEIEDTKQKISTYKQRVEYAERELKKLTEPLNGEDKKREKRLKTIQIDGIYYIDKLSQKVRELNKELKKFENKKRDEFFDAFFEFKINLEKKFKDILSAYYFLLNKLLWKLAKKSSAINGFFKESKIKSVGTKAFIEYNLKNIDMSKVHKKEWYKYLQSILPLFKE